MIPNPLVFLVDVDDTLLDNDRIQSDLRRHLQREFGAAGRDRYWAILEQLFTYLGYRDYLGALQRYRVEHPIHLLSVSSFLVDYPFANRLYPGSLDVLDRFRSWGQTVILSDGDVVFQPRKVVRSGLFEAVEGHVLIYIHKEEALDDVEQRYPARHHVLVDDTPYPGRGQERLGRTRDHGISPPGSVCERPDHYRGVSARGHRSGADRRPARL